MTINKQHGYSLFELIVVIIIIAILASIAVRSLETSTDVARMEKTKRELAELAIAIAGDPHRTSGGNRIDFGYIGDVGSMPPDLAALVTNPGGLATWKGPYVRDDFYPSAAAAETEYGLDGWGKGYSYSAGNSITSAGGPTTITQQFGPSIDALLRNRVSTVVVDLDRSPPGSSYRDSVLFLFTYPNGAGGLITRSATPSGNGSAVFDSIPIGRHTLQTVYLPTNDTLTRPITINPGADVYAEVQFPSELW